MPSPPLVTRGSCLLALLANAFACGGTPAAEEATVFAVDQVWDRSRAASAASTPADRDYVAAEGERRYQVHFQGDRVTVRSPDGKVMSGRRRVVGATTRYELDAFAGGHFDVRGDRAELTVYGSGVPVVSSERGTLVAPRR